MSNRKTTHTLRALAWLLRYPDAELRAALPELINALRTEGVLPASRLDELDQLATKLAMQPPLRIESDYVDLFDRSRQTALHLFEHVHGDSRDRGQAMIDLGQTYERAGLLMAPGELPDYLPVVLEYASTQPPAAARAFLAETAHIVRAIFSALIKRNSGYASVLAAVLDLAGERAEPVQLIEEPALDESWAEPEAFGGCSSAGQSKPGQPQPIHVVRPAARRPSPNRAA
jgi:nitrate reductase molybdenum cofactor assembly chaperone NarJ/NarW